MKNLNFAKDKALFTENRKGVAALTQRETYLAKKKNCNGNGVKVLKEIKLKIQKKKNKKKKRIVVAAVELR